MTPQDETYAALLLEWSRSLPEHGLTWDAWIEARG